MPDLAFTQKENTMSKLTTFAAALTLCAAATMSYAETWTLDASVSKISFGSIKNDSIGESHTFEDINGAVNDDGAVTLKIGLPSVQTMIDVRNERMVAQVFKNAVAATISAQVDMAELTKLPVGEATTVETEGTLSLIGTDTALDAALFVIRLSENRVLVTTDGMIMLDLEEAGLSEGISTLQELASLDSITRVSPVTMRLIFDTKP